MEIEQQYKIKEFIDPHILLSFRIEGHLEIAENGDVVFVVDRIEKKGDGDGRYTYLR